MMLRKRYHLIFVFILFLLPFGRYFQTISGYWRWDDTAILLRLLKNPVWKYFCIPSVYQELSCSNLTPWVMLSYQGDLTLFGLNPTAFYLHHLLSLSFIAVAGYCFLSLWVNKKFAFLGMILFINGAPVATVMQQLMTRHYLEGLLFAILALHCFVLFLRGKKHCYLIASVVFYVLAVTAKEIYVPLVCLLPWIPEQTIKTRLKAMIPFILVAFFYVVWRQYMLISLLGSYTRSSDSLYLTSLSEIFTGFEKIPSLFAGDLWKPFFLLYLIVLFLYMVFAKANMLISVIVFVLIILPLVPVIHGLSLLSGRYLLLIWFALCFSLAYCLGMLYEKTYSLSKKSKKILMSLFVISWITILPIICCFGYESERKIKQISREYDTQGRFVWMNNDQTMYFIPSKNVVSGFYYVNSLCKIKKQIKKNLSSPTGVVDEIYLHKDITKLFSYDVACNCMKDISTSLEERISNAETSIRWQAPLSVYFNYIPGDVTWEFGPYANGSYHFIADEVGVIPLPKRGNLKALLKDDFSFRVRYTSPEGWKTYSPLFMLNPQGMAINWEQK